MKISLTLMATATYHLPQLIGSNHSETASLILSNCFYLSLGKHFFLNPYRDKVFS